MADIKAFVEQLVGLTVKEVKELAQILKEGIAKDQADNRKKQMLKLKSNNLVLSINENTVPKEQLEPRFIDLVSLFLS